MLSLEKMCFQYIFQCMSSSRQFGDANLYEQVMLEWQVENSIIYTENFSSGWTFMREYYSLENIVALITTSRPIQKKEGNSGLRNE